MNSSAMMTVAMLRPVENTLVALQREWGSSVQPLKKPKEKMPPILTARDECSFPRWQFVSK
jgi:hypothetical protein